MHASERDARQGQGLHQQGTRLEGAARRVIEGRKERSFFLVYVLFLSCVSVSLYCMYVRMPVCALGMSFFLWIWFFECWRTVSAASFPGRYGMPGVTGAFVMFSTYSWVSKAICGLMIQPFQLSSVPLYCFFFNSI